MKEKYYDDPKENAAFLRHVDVVTNMILKYGPALKRKWAREALFNTVWLDCFFKESAVKRYMAYLTTISPPRSVSNVLPKIISNMTKSN